MKKIMLIFCFSITLFLISCEKTDRINIIDNYFIFEGNKYVPSDRENFSPIKESFNTEIGWTYNLYFKKARFYVSDTDINHNYVYTSCLPDSFWIKEGYEFFDVNEYIISKISIWEFYVEPIRNVETIIYTKSSEDNDMYITDLFTESINSSDGYIYMYNLTIELISINNIYIGNIILASKNDEIIVRGLDDLYDYDAYIISDVLKDLISQEI